MDRTELVKVLEAAAAERGCAVAALDVNLGDCESVHRAVLAAFDRDVEDYALTVGSAGISGAEADALLKEMEDND